MLKKCQTHSKYVKSDCIIVEKNKCNICITGNRASKRFYKKNQDKILDKRRQHYKKHFAKNSRLNGWAESEINLLKQYCKAQTVFIQLRKKLLKTRSRGAILYMTKRLNLTQQEI